MHGKIRRWAAILVAWSLLAPGLLEARDPEGVNESLQAGFILLEQGKLHQAHGVLQGVLRRDPTHPLALNNLAAILGQQGKYDQALSCLKRALPRARGIKVALNRVCNIDGICAACCPSQGDLGAEDLEAVIKTNILMVEMARSRRPSR
jgi:tetratricopeptide (TPR) repeat protein